MRKSNGWKPFFWLLWLVAIFAFAYFKQYIPVDCQYNYGFIAGSVCLFVLYLKRIFGEN